MNADELREAGELLFGPQWQVALARELGVSDRRVRRWVAAGQGCPAGMDDAIRGLLRVRVEKIVRFLT